MNRLLLTGIVLSILSLWAGIFGFPFYYMYKILTFIIFLYILIFVFKYTQERDFFPQLFSTFAAVSISPFMHYKKSEWKIVDLCIAIFLFLLVLYEDRNNK